VIYFYLLTFYWLTVVPIYDAHNLDVYFPDIISSLKNVPRFSEELPPGSCAVIAYTINTFDRRDESIVCTAFNVHWAMLLGLQTR